MRISVDTAAQYHIELQGALDPSWNEELADMHIEHCRLPDGRVITTLRGTLADQAALAGVLNLAFRLGLPLLSVLCCGRRNDLPQA
jgi:hypothetical protein